MYGRIQPALILLGCLAAIGAGPACNPLECGEGTREEGGRCVPLNFPGGDGGLHCGPHTVLIGNECVPLTDICGPYTEAVPELDDAGVPTGGFICVGQESGDPTELKPPECPTGFGPAGEICINGAVHWLFDEATGGWLESRMFDAEAPGDATAAVVKVYDPLLYAQDPTTSPLGLGEVNPHNGTFRVTDIPVPGTGFLALVVEDPDDAVDDRFALTGVPYVAVQNQHLEDVVAFAVTHDQVAEWTDAIGGDAMLAAIGCPAPAAGGDRTLLTCGTWIGVYLAAEPVDSVNPVEGVIPREPGGIVPPSDTFYPGISVQGALVFDDATPGVVWSDDQGPHEWTGHLGAVFYPTATLGNMTGECAPGTDCADAACVFLEVLGGAVLEALFVQFMLPVTCSR